MTEPIKSVNTSVIHEVLSLMHENVDLSWPSLV